MAPPVVSQSITEPLALVDGRAALILSHVLAGRLHNRAALPVVLAEMKLEPVDVRAALAAAAALEDAGESWRLGRLARPAETAATPEAGGNGGEAGSDGSMASPSVRVSEAAEILGLSRRRVRQLAAAGDLRGRSLPGRGWRFEREDVLRLVRQRAAA